MPARGLFGSAWGDARYAAHRSRNATSRSPARIRVAAAGRPLARMPQVAPQPARALPHRLVALNPAAPREAVGPPSMLSSASACWRACSRSTSMLLSVSENLCLPRLAADWAATSLHAPHLGSRLAMRTPALPLGGGVSSAPPAAVAAPPARGPSRHSARGREFPAWVPNALPSRVSNLRLAMLPAWPSQGGLLPRSSPLLPSAASRRYFRLQPANLSRLLIESALLLGSVSCSRRCLAAPRLPPASARPRVLGPHALALAARREGPRCCRLG